MNSELDEIIVSELDRLYRFAYNRVNDEYKAEDIVQDIVLTAYRAYPRLKDKSRTLPWLWGIARNVVLQSFKPASEIPTEEVAIIDACGISYETPESVYLRKQELAKVRKAVSFLSKKYRDVCVLFYLEDKDYLTISKELEIPVSSVKWRLNQARNQLKEELTKMEYMENGYKKAVPLKISMGGWVGKWDRAKGNYDGADQALDGLLPQNICIDIYETPKTVTEIASDLGVAADYVEEALQKLVSTQSVKKTGNTYQTMFPIWSAEIYDDVFGGNLRYARSEAKEIFDKIVSLADAIRDVGFYGSAKGMDKLILFLIGFVCYGTNHNAVDMERCPFTGDDKAWYILASTGKDYPYMGSCGINTNGSTFGLVEFYFSQEFTKDNRSSRTEEQEAFYSLYLGKPVADTYSLSRLVESGKVIKIDDQYRITVPVISSERGEWGRLKATLAPVFEQANRLQSKILERSVNAVKKYIPRHIAGQEAFFGEYCAHGALEHALFEELRSRGIAVTQEMATWYAVK